MEEKTIEEIMADISSTTTASTTNEPMVVNLGNTDLSEVSIVSQSPVAEVPKTMTLGGWATFQNIRLLDTKFYNDTNLYTYEQYREIVPREMEVALFTEGMKPEVQEMVLEQHSDFYNQNIEKDMDVLEKEYVKMERAAADIDEQIAAYKEANKAIFDGLAELEAAKEKSLEHKEDYREVICSKLEKIGEKKWKGIEVQFTYIAATTKTSFDKKRFEKEQPIMYNKYCSDTPVKAYIKTTLNLLPKELRDQVDSVGK